MQQEQIIQAVWNKANAIVGYNPNIWRQDIAGAWICRTQYGTTDSFGWEIDHIRPLSQGGVDNLGNMQALHWKNNRAKSDNYPTCETVLSSEGNTLIERRKTWTIQ